MIMKNFLEKTWFQREIEPDTNKLVYRIIELEEECILMEHYIANQGKEIPETYLNELASLSVYVDKVKDKLSTPDEIDDKGIQDNYLLAMRIHNKLGMMCTPANAVSIKFTEYSKGFFFKRNNVVNALLLLTFLCLVSFIVLKVINIDPRLKSIFTILAASGLGAGFYTLGTVRKYLINRTYNPRYNPTYIIRFFLGVTAGSILAYILSTSLGNNDYNLTVDALAVVGGFAADAVNTILRRISEVLIAVFRGIQDDTAPGTQIINQEKNLTKQQTKIKSIEELTKLKSQVVKKNTAEDVVKEIDKSIETIDKS